MPPAVQFTRKEVIDAAFEIVRDQGLEKLSARLVAQALKSSTTPIYSLFGSMEALEIEVLKKIAAQKRSYETVSYTGSTFIDIGLGYVRFAREEKKLFRGLFQSAHSKMLLESMLQEMTELMKTDEGLSDLDAEQIDQIVRLGWYYIHGIASFANVDFAAPVTDGEIVDAIQRVALPVIAEMRKRKGALP